MFDSQCSGKTIKTKDEVNKYLEEVRRILNISFNNLKIQKRTNGEDETNKFMIEHGITPREVYKQILELDAINYSYTDKDTGKNRIGNVWIFGKILIIEEGNKYFEVYIKLKLVRNVLCLSFHPKKFKLEYPYL